MSRCSILRSTFRASQSIRRNSTVASSSSSASTSAPPTPRNASPTLPDDKMRALIELYHQTDSFITPENLDAAIDRTFLKVSEPVGSQAREVGHRDLVSIVRGRRALPKIGGDGRVPGLEYEVFDGTLIWSETKTQREGKVVNALYGLEDGKRPGLDMLKDEEQRIQEHLKQDRQS